MNVTDTSHFTFRCATETDMRALGAAIGERCGKGDCIILSGDLGTGKTTFARGLIRRLTSAETEVVSPTFTLVQHYEATAADGAPLPLMHADLYRLEHTSELEELGLEDGFENGIVLIEWPKLATTRIPPAALWLAFIEQPDGSRIVEGSGVAWSERLKGIAT